MNDKKSLRLFFFGIGLVAVIALTGMNVYSMYELRESAINTAYDNKKDQIEEFTNNVRSRFSQPFRGIRKLDIEHLQMFYARHSDFPENFKDVLYEASQDPIFEAIYFSPENVDNCLNPSDPIFQFDASTKTFVRLEKVPELVCDGLGLARSRMKVLIDDYRWNNKATFDTHRSMTLSMIDLTQREVFGHLNFSINRDYLVNDYFAQSLREAFGPSEETGIVVWLRDFMQEEVLTSSDESIIHSNDIIDIRQRFQDLLENWVLHAKIIDSPTIAASNASFIRNLVVLGSAVLALFGALLFMFITAKRERELAQRQAGFLANVTHELKTPLAAMQAAGENLSDGRVTDSIRIKTYGSHIYTETIRLRKMIEKLLDIARVDSGQSMVQMVPKKLGGLVEAYYDAHQNFIRSKGFKLDLEIDQNLPEVLIDPDHFETILSNLIDNAVKYSFDEKHISLKVKRNDRFVSLHVSDRGIGIPPKSHKQIFEKFYRLEDSMTAKTKGHGLGLSIVKNLVKLNNGTIRLDSTVNRGTTFIVEFPVYETKDSFERHIDREFDHVKKNLHVTEYVK